MYEVWSRLQLVFQEYPTSLNSSSATCSESMILELQSPHSLLFDADFAARIESKKNIFEAAKIGNLDLVKDHITADPSCILKKNP